MGFIDTHAHIYLPEFDQDRSAVIQAAEKEGITKILLPAIDATTHDAMLKTANDFPDVCVSMMGLHPCSVKENFGDELLIVRELLEKEKFIAVGEIGLDFYWDVSYAEQQYDAFNEQIELALPYEIPIAIHSRNATAECIKVVAAHQKGKLRGVFHCFSGTLTEAKQVSDLGFYLGIGGVLTFKNSGLDRVIEEVDMAHIVLETDAPFLAPVPFRGKRNETAYLKLIAQKLADLKKISLKEVEEITTANAAALFGINL